MKILVCGGAGYIGSHMVKHLVDAGHSVVVLDNLSTGHREAVACATLLEADLNQPTQLEEAFSRASFDAVIHFSARSLVGESISEPYKYYHNNVAGTLNLLAAMRRHGVEKIVFSSTAAIFGNPCAGSIDEDHPVAPINPYGRSKYMVEQLLSDAARAYGLRSAALRYFNAAGADPDGGLGESHHPETHLIPNLLRSVLGAGPKLRIFGDDYPTKDGTCVRDYVHVSDLVSAHVLALDYLDQRPGAHAFNLGNGIGFSVLEVIAAASSVTGSCVDYEVVGRREGDPAVLVASSDKAKRLMGWSPKYQDIQQIIDTAWRWHKNPRF